jgi:hypothetical protein
LSIHYNIHKEQELISIQTNCKVREGNILLSIPSIYQGLKPIHTYFKKKGIGFVTANSLLNNRIEIPLDIYEIEVISPKK